MVAFHDRRNKTYTSVDEVRGSLPVGEQDTLSKHLIDGRYVVRGEKTPEQGREFVLHEILPNGKQVERGRDTRRYRAQNLTRSISPTSVYEI